MLKDLAEKVCGIAGWDVTPVMVDGRAYEVPAEVLDHLHYKQPVFDGVEGVALLADYVGTEDGTGIVHNSPGHGVDDYYVCMKEGMDVCMPVDDDGRFYSGDECWPTTWAPRTVPVSFTTRPATAWTTTTSA